MAQCVHPKVIMKIHELVGASISELSEVRRALKLYITKELFQTDLPNRDDRAYYPTNHDLSVTKCCNLYIFQLAVIWSNRDMNNS